MFESVIILCWCSVENVMVFDPESWSLVMSVGVLKEDR